MPKNTAASSRSPVCRKPSARSSRSRGSIRCFRFFRTSMLRSPRHLNQNLQSLRDVLRNIELRRRGNDTCSNRKSNMSLPKEKNVLPLVGEIDLNVSPPIVSTFHEMIRKKPSRLVVDLSRVTYIDSSGLARLICVLP